VFEWGQCYTRHFVLYITDPIQIIANINITVCTRVDSITCRSETRVFSRLIFCQSKCFIPTTCISGLCNQLELKKRNLSTLIQILANRLRELSNSVITITVVTNSGLLRIKMLPFRVPNVYFIT